MRTAPVARWPPFWSRGCWRRWWRRYCYDGITCGLFWWYWRCSFCWSADTPLITWRRLTRGFCSRSRGGQQYGLSRAWQLLIAERYITIRCNELLFIADRRARFIQVRCVCMFLSLFPARIIGARGSPECGFTAVLCVRGVRAAHNTDICSGGTDHWSIRGRQVWGSTVVRYRNRLFRYAGSMRGSLQRVECAAFCFRGEEHQHRSCCHFRIRLLHVSARQINCNNHALDRSCSVFDRTDIDPFPESLFCYKFTSSIGRNIMLRDVINLESIKICSIEKVTTMKLLPGEIASYNL